MSVMMMANAPDKRENTYSQGFSLYQNLVSVVMRGKPLSIWT